MKLDPQGIILTKFQPDTLSSHRAEVDHLFLASEVEATASEVEVTASEVTNQHPGTWYSVILV